MIFSPFTSFTQNFVIRTNFPLWAGLYRCVVCKEDLVIFVFKQISHFRSFGKCVHALCLPEPASTYRRWKHELQIPLLQRRATVARTVLPNPSARAEWLFAGIIDRALHHQGHVPALDGLDLTSHFQMTMMKSSPSRVFRRDLCSLPVSGGSVLLFCLAPRGAPLLLF